MVTQVATRRIKPQRTKEEMQTCRDAIVEVLQLENPMTLRAVFYRLVSRGIIPKLEKEYGKLSRMLCQMREAGLVPWEWVVDNTRSIEVPSTWRNIAHLLQSAEESYRLNPWRDQPVRAYVMTEKDAIASVLASVTYDYVVPLAVVRGYSSRTFLHDIAEHIADADKPAHVFYFGDRDDSGLYIQNAAERILRHFAPNVEIHFTRLAVTPEQIEEYSLITRPGKPLGVHGKQPVITEAVEVDAMPMDVLRTLTREAIESVLHFPLYDKTISQQQRDIDELQKFVRKHRSRRG